MYRQSTMTRLGSMLAGGLMLSTASTAFATVIVGPNINVSQRLGSQSEQAITINPAAPNNIYIGTNDTSVSGAMGSARSSDGGASWTLGNVATGADGLAAACCDPSFTYDRFGNLYTTYLDNFLGSGGNPQVIVGRSTDNGATWTQIANLGLGDQPTIVVGPGAGAGDDSVWVQWNDGSNNVAAGATATGLGVLSAFSATQTAPLSTSGSFGDIAVGAGGKVAVAWQNSGSGNGPDSIRVQVDADGIGGSNFGNPVVAAPTNVGGFDFLPAQPNRSVDAESGLAWDLNTNRLFLVYTDETVDENNDFDILLSYSDDDGATWSGPARVNDDATTNSQFLSKIALDPVTGNIVIVWYDARDDDGTGAGGQRSAGANNEVELFGTFSLDGGNTFLPNFQISTGVSSALFDLSNFDFGDYIGVDFFNGIAHVVWADNSNSTGDNPGATANGVSFDAYTASIQLIVPEPGTLVLFGLGLIGLGVARRRKAA